MALRMYLTNTAAGYTPPTKRGAWDNNSATLARLLSPAKSGSAATAAALEGVATDDYDVLWGRWVSDPFIYAGDLEGTVEWVMGVLESSSLADQVSHLHLYVTVGSTDVVRGTVLSDSIGATEFPTTGTGRGEGLKTLTTVACSVGDRLVAEIGYRTTGTTGGNLCSNPSFVTNTTGWAIQSGNAATLSRLTGQTIPGSATTTAGRVTKSAAGSGNAYAFFNPTVDPAPGSPVRLTANVRRSLGTTVDWLISYHDAGDAFISSDGGALTVTENVWSSLDVTGTVPANTANIYVLIGRTAAAANATIDFTDVSFHVSFTGTLHYGNTGSTDLSAGNTSVTTRPGWLEFSDLEPLYSATTHTALVEQYAPFNEGAGADTAESMWRNFMRHMRDDGVIATREYPNPPDELIVYADSTGMQVKVWKGEVWIRGHWGELLDEHVQTLSPSDPTNPRIDRVVARADFVANRVEFDVLTGTPAGSPVAQALTNNTSRWEIPLAQVRVDPGVVTISADKVTDERIRVGYGIFNSWTPPLYYEAGVVGGTNAVGLGSTNNPQTGWPAAKYCRYHRRGTMVQIRYDFRWGGQPGFAGGWDRIWTPLPPGMVHANNGPSRLTAHLWVQKPDGSDTDWRGTALIDGGSTRMYPMFNLSETRADMGFYRIASSSALTAGTGIPLISAGYPEGGSLVIAGVIEVQ